MAHDVFVSHSAKDKTVAQTVVAELEEESIGCWVAPRDVVPGADWGESIINAIESSRIMVLIFSRNANDSSQIKREVERAVDKNVYIIPFRIDDIEPTKSLEYFISTAQWMDAFPPPVEQHLDFLAKTVKAILAGRPPPLPPAPPPAPRPPAKSRSYVGIVIAAVALLFLAVGGWFLADRNQTSNAIPRPAPEPIATETAAPTAAPLRITPTPPAPAAPEVPGIAGLWRDSDNPANVAQIAQDGERFTFNRSGVLPDGTQFKATGSGTISGTQLTSRYDAAFYHPLYQTSSTSTGYCTGSISADARQMEMSCTDSLFGYTFGRANRDER